MSDTNRSDQAGGARVMLTILLAEDDANLRSMLAIVLRREGHRVLEFRDGGELHERLAALFREGEAASEDLLIISDLRMPDVDGLTLMQGLRDRGHRPPFILLTAFGSPGIHAEANGLGALAVLDKPFDFDALRAVVRHFGHQRGVR